MNEIVRDVLLKKNLYTCHACNKQYSRKHSFEKHKILCDIKYKTINERNIENEEIGDIPNYGELVKIVQQLTIKHHHMEEQLNTMQKWVDKKKKKINIINWLKTNIIPTLTFNEWISSFEVHQHHYEYLLENTIFQSVQQIFECNLNELSNAIYPFTCFSQKVGIFYLYEDDKWRQASTDDILDLLIIIQKKVIDTLTQWQIENQKEINGNDKLSCQFNKSIIKLMDISITQNAHFGKFKTGFYNYLKMDMNRLIEYEYEF
jgi:hypothetical protein